MIIRRLSIAGICALLLAFHAFAQVPMTGAGLGKPTAAAGFTGPIDINGTAFAFWSTRCGATAYTGNVVDIWDGATGSTTETLITCSSGGVLNQTINSLATTCLVSCRYKTFYDQSGSNNCSGACDATQATNASRSAVTVSCQNSKICAIIASASSNCYATPNTSAAQNQIFTTSAVYIATDVTNFGTLWASSNHSSSDVNFSNGTANQALMYAGLQATATATDNAQHAVQALYNSSSSAMYIDGSLTSGLNAFTQPIRSAIPMFIGGDNAGTSCSGDFFDGKFFEFGIWSGDKTGNNATMNSNQHTYWSF